MAWWPVEDGHMKQIGPQEKACIPVEPLTRVMKRDSLANTAALRAAAAASGKQIVDHHLDMGSIQHAKNLLLACTITCFRAMA